MTKPEKIRKVGFTSSEAKLVAEALAVYSGMLVSDAGAARRRGYVRAADTVDAERDLVLQLRARVIAHG